MSILTHRPRRMRKHEFNRSLIRENSLSISDLIYPLFIIEGENKKEKIDSMPGIERLSIDQLLIETKEIVDLKIQAIALFPVISPDKKTLEAEESYNPDGLIQKAVRTLKRNFPDLAVITDVALDPFTSHGLDGVIDSNGYVLNDETVNILVKQALSHAQAGADIVAPSDMMDGRVLSIRKTLEDNGFHDIGIMSYAVKYASNFYGPFRDALDSKPGFGDKKTYQMDFRNRSEAIAEAKSDIEEGADIIMVKPGISYLDVLRDLKNQVHCPLAIYQVSGEYSMLKAAAKEGWLDHDKVMMEQLVSMKRAGADIIASYFAKDAIKLLS